MNRGFGAAPNKTIAANPRYASTVTKLDTGPNMRKILEAGGGGHAHKKPKDEFFVRLKGHTLGRLLEPLVASEESIFSLGKEDTRSVVSSVVPDSAGTSSSEGNICIFDMRPFEDFDKCHVYGARHLDPSQINRSTNNLPREVFFFKGPIECDKMVVLYDEDGRSARQFGNTFVERGVENTYVVSGGFLGVCATAPHVLVGEPPSHDNLATLLSRAGLKVPTGGASASSVASARSDRCSTAGTVRTQATNLTSMAGGGGSSAGRPWK